MSSESLEEGVEDIKDELIGLDSEDQMLSEKKGRLASEKER